MSDAQHHEIRPRSGHWHCRHCHGPADVEDPGEPQPRCARCGCAGLVWLWEEETTTTRARPPASSEAPVRELNEGGRTRRLPAAQRSFGKFLREGGLFCHACEHVTKRNPDGRCALCGADQVEEIPPLFEEDAA